MDLPERLPFSKKRLAPRVIISYILDYVIIVLLVISFTALEAVEPFHQHFSLRNYTLQYPFAVKERVPILVAAFVAVVCPAIIIIVYTMIIDGIFSHHIPTGSTGGKRKLLNGRYRLKDRLWEMNCGILGLGLSVAAAYTITGALKNATGKPRPDLIDRCKPKAGSQDPLPFGLSDITICTQTNHAILKDGFRSFPSGHSSTAFSGLFYLSLYLSGKMHILDNRGEVWKTFIVLVPTLGAALIADSRIMDARHHPFDVISGSLLGIATAWASYRQYFGPITESWRKGRAYGIRTWGQDPVQPNERETSPFDRSVEPLRAPADRENTAPDEEAVGTSYQAPGPGTAPENNVFREQIHRSQRQRRIPADVEPVATYHIGNPYGSAMGARGSQRHDQHPHDGYVSSSSEDQEWGHEDGLELEHQYTLSDPHGTDGHFVGEDTAYSGSVPSRLDAEPLSGHVQESVQPPVHMPPEIDHTAPPAPSPQLLQQHAARKPVDLVETYAPGAR